MNKNQTIHVRLTGEEYAAFKSLCTDEGTTISTLLRQKVQEMTSPSTVSEWE